MAVLEPPIRKKASNLRYDALLIVTVVALVAFGLVMVFSTTWDISYFKYNSPTWMLLKQLVSLGVGLLALSFFAWVPRKWWRGLAMLMIVVTLMALVYVAVQGVRGFRPGQFMPSEAAKLSIILYMALWLTSRGDKLRDWGYGIVPFAVIVGVVTVLILFQPDISAAATVVIISGLMFFIAGADLRQMLASASASIGVGYLVWQISPNAQQRVAEYLSGLANLKNASYHIQQAIGSFVAGSWFGRGLGESRQKFGLLPNPHTDSVFAVVGEELGVVGGLALFALFVLLFWRGLKISARASDPMSSLLAAGLTLWLGIEALINIAVIVGLIPFAGNALPFISFGGSSLVVSLAAIGLLLNISKNGNVEAAPMRKTVANLDFSRGNRRRRVPGAVGSARAG